MKVLVLLSFLTIFPALLIGQPTRETEIDSLCRPLPAGATVREQAEQYREILWYQFVNNISNYSPWVAQLDSLFHCCIDGKSGDRRFEKTIEADLDFYKGAEMMKMGYYPDSTIRFFESALVKYTAIGDSLNIGWSHLVLSGNAIVLGDSLSFAKHYDKALRYSHLVKQSVDRRHFFMLCAVQCRFFERYAESASHFFKVLESADEFSGWHATFIKAHAMSGIAEIYYEIRDFENAERYSRMAVQAGSEAKAHADSHYKMLGLIMIEREAYKEALPMLIKAEGCEECNAHPAYAGIILAAKATCYRKLGDLKTALSLAKKAVQITSVAENVPVGAVSLMELAECEFALGMTDKALHNALVSYETFFSSKNNWGKVRASELLTTIYKSKGDYRKALEYSELHNQHQQHVERQKSNRQLAMGEFTRDNAAQKARREAEVQAQLDQQRTIRYALFAGLGILALLAFLLFHRYRFKQRTAEQLEAKNREVEAARARAEASEAFKSRFLAHMSHEIRTPLHGIAGFTDLLLDTALSEKQRRWLSSIHHSAGRLGEVVNDILDLSKLEAGGMKLRQVPFSPARVAADVQEALALRAENQGIELFVSIGENVPEAVLGDPTRLYQILMNLVGNAVKFTEQGYVRLTVDGSHAHTLTTLTFSISDTGIGIPPEKLATVFDSFQQSGEDTTARFGGTGLGLTIARELVQLHGSGIRAVSEVGKGSTFSFTLALPSADAADLERTAGAGDTLYFCQPLRILLTDDNALNREIATEAIRRHFENAEITETVNGKEAVERLESGSAGLASLKNLSSPGRYDIILMDMQMPEMSGVEATRHIRQHISADIPIIALTASATPEEIENALQSGMNRHLGKPFKPHELARVVAETLGLTVSEDHVPHTSTGFQNPEGLPNHFDLGFLRDFCHGDEERMRYFMQKFMELYPTEISRLEAAVQAEDREAVYQAAHSFRPQLEFVGLKEATQLALLLEKGARGGMHWGELSELLAQIRTELETFRG